MSLPPGGSADGGRATADIAPKIYHDCRHHGRRPAAPVWNNHRMATDSIHAAPAVRPWRPAAALKASAVLHVGSLAALAAAPEAWGAVLGAIAANHAVLFGAGLAPRSRLLGPNLTRLPEASSRRGEIAITFDDGPDPEVTPRVLDELDRAGARATFFCVGTRAHAYAGLVHEIVRRGHAVENHSQRHSTAFGWYGPGRLRREIAAAQDTLTALAGRSPAFFRAPFGVRNPFVDPVLARLGLAYVSWTRRGYDTVDGDAGRVLDRLARELGAGDVLVLHDGVATGAPRARPTVLEVLPRLLELAASRQLRPVTLATACRDGA
jgi:peptidoglycan/xylan/chitin deacetylase (PgdA/CDA1 family)